MVNGKNVIMIPNELSSVVISKIFSLHFLICAEHRTKKKFNLERPVTRFFTQTVCRRNKSFISKKLNFKEQRYTKRNMFKFLRSNIEKRNIHHASTTRDFSIFAHI